MKRTHRTILCLATAVALLAAPVVAGGSQTSDAERTRTAASSPAANTAEPTGNRSDTAGEPDAAERMVLQVPVWQVSAGELAERPEAYYGRVVSVTAEVERIAGPRAFTLDEDRLGAGPDVLVLLPQTAAGISDGDTARVVGTVRPLVATELARDFDWLDAGWERGLEIELRERPVVVATSVVVDNDELMAYDLVE